MIAISKCGRLEVMLALDKCTVQMAVLNQQPAVAKALRIQEYTFNGWTLGVDPYPAILATAKRVLVWNADTCPDYYARMKRFLSEQEAREAYKAIEKLIRSFDSKSCSNAKRADYSPLTDREIICRVRALVNRADGN